MSEKPRIALTASATTDAGRVRSNNEDAFLIAAVRQGEQEGERRGTFDLLRTAVILAVADGLGGEAAGEEASRLAVLSLSSVLRSRLAHRGPSTALTDAMHAANDAVILASVEMQSEGMGTTLTALLAIGEEACLASVGDSRAYLLRAGRLVRLTRDETLYQEALDTGASIPNPADIPRYKSTLLRAIGRAPVLSVHVEKIRLFRDDRFLLCTDGLPGELTDEELRTILLSGAPDVVSGRLVGRALAHGGRDNVTAVVAMVRGGVKATDRDLGLPAVVSVKLR